MTGKEIVNLIREFPSPLGELYFLIQSQKVIRADRVRMVSVPSRGAIFLNQRVRYQYEYYYWFPSPLGELYFLITELNDLLWFEGFRPLSGSYIS